MRDSCTKEERINQNVTAREYSVFCDVNKKVKELQISASIIMYGKDGVSKTETKNVNYESAYRCRICEKTFRKFIIFEGHFAFNAKCRAKNGWLHQCYICGEAFHHLALVKYHLRRHVNKNRTTNDQHKESLDVFNCNICQRKFITNFYLKNHMVLHSKKSITKKPQTNGDHRNGSSDEIVNSAKTSSFQCQICNIDCSDKTALGNV